MNERQACEHISATTIDYRPLGGAMSADHVYGWAEQFPQGSRLSLLREIAHVLDRTYVSESAWRDFLVNLLTTEELVGDSAEEFWRSVNFFQAQKRGDSQREMLEMFDGVLSETLGFGIAECGSDSGPWVYLDDAIFTGTHVRWDLLDWVRDTAPTTCVMHVIVIANHPGRVQYTESELQKAAKAAGKTLTTRWWRVKTFETRPSRDTEVLWPSVIPDDVNVIKLVEQLSAFGHPPRLRTAVTQATNGVFSGEIARKHVEQELLIAGARLKYELAPALKQNHWPLGYDVLKSMGFGSLLVTYRNCANNCALALWCGDPWRPLFPRETNR